MRAVILICCCLVSLVASLPAPEYEDPTYNLKYFLTEPSPGVYVKEDLTIQNNYTADVSDIKIYFHSKTTGRDGIEVDLTDPSTVGKTDFSNSKESVFLVHGWHSNKDSGINTGITQAYLQVKDVNVFIVDWSKVAKDLYVIAQANVQSLGEILAQLIDNLVKSGGLDLGKTALIGHSLGAHIAGVAGANLGGAVEHVVGLDPAGPLFIIIDTFNRITTNSGKFVQIIHTNAGILGWNHELGHADYWPNGGFHQPGCGTDITGSCAHSRSYAYFSESVVSGNFNSRICQDWDTYENGGCANGKKSYLGQDPIDKSAAGNYFLETNEKSPYAQGG